MGGKLTEGIERGSIPSVVFLFFNSIFTFRNVYENILCKYACGKRVRKVFTARR